MSERAVYITNIASFLPNAAVGNDDMERILGQVGARPSRAKRMVLRSNGITSRHYAIDPQTLKHNYTNAEITAAAVRALEGGQALLDQLDCLVCGTSIPDQVMPSHGSMVQGELKLPACEVAATTGVCLSGVAALKYAYMGILSGLHRSAIACGSDLPSGLMTANNFAEEIEAKVAVLESRPELAFENDFLRWMLSDGAGAAQMADVPAVDGLSLRIDWLDILSYAGDMESCMYAGAVKNEDGSLSGWQQFGNQQRNEQSVMTIKQDVKLLNKNIIYYTVEKPLIELKKKYALSAEEIDWFVPHYSSSYFRDKVYSGMQAADLDIPQSRWFSNLTTKGNTGAASIYIMLEELLHSGRLQAGQKLLCYIPESGRFSTAFIHLTVV